MPVEWHVRQGPAGRGKYPVAGEARFFPSAVAASDFPVGRVVGESLGDDLKILSIDEISLSELDFIDIGSPTGPDSYVPVVVKSLVFEG